MKVYVISDGYDYEGEKVVVVFDDKKKAKKHLNDWKKNYKKEMGISYCEELPFGFKFGTHYRIAQEFEINEVAK